MDNEAKFGAWFDPNAYVHRFCKNKRSHLQFIG